MAKRLVKSKADPNDLAIGQNLRRLRLARHMSQEKLANNLDLTFQQVQKYEMGKNRLSGSRMVYVCNVLKCDVGDLFVGTDIDRANKQRLTDDDGGLAFLTTRDGRD